MAVLIITYDLDGKNKDYAPLFEAIKETSDKWWHYITDAWLVHTQLTAKEFFDALLPHIDEKKDFIFVAEITKNYSGWLPEKAWEWIRNRNIK